MVVVPQQAVDPFPPLSRRLMSAVQLRAVFRALVPAPEDFIIVAVYVYDHACLP